MNVLHALDKELRATQELKKSWADAFAEDAELMADTIEGETDLVETIIDVMASVDEDQLLLDGIAARLKDLGERKSRIAKRIETKRTIVLQALVIAERKSVEAPTFTLTKKAVAPGLIVSEEADIPAIYWKPQAPKLDKAALKSVLKDGEHVPGATLDNGGITLQIRRK